MKGIARHTEALIEPASRLDCLKGWVLVGGTALAIQLGHRLSEDLDFMRWQTRRDERMDVDWPTIRKQLETVGKVESMDILDHNHVEFVVAGVKFSFYARESKAPEMTLIPFMNNIVLADAASIAVMKMDGNYSNHMLKSKHILTMLTDYRRFGEDRNFSQLEPAYSIGAEEIETYIKRLLQKPE